MKLKIAPLIISSLFLAACASSPTNTESVTNASQPVIESELPYTESEVNSPESDETHESSISKMTFTMSVYTETPNENSSVKIQYPVFTGEGSEKVNALVYDKVQSFASLDTELFSEDSALTIDYQAEVTLQNSKIASMVFWGTSYIDDSLYVTSDIYPLNIDLKTMEEVSFNDLYQINTGFSEVFFENALFPTEPITSYDADSFSEMLKLQTPEYQTVDPFSIPGNVTCFLKPDGIVLSMPSIHATGSDHFEAQIQYGLIQPFYLLQENYWD